MKFWYRINSRNPWELDMAGACWRAERWSHLSPGHSLQGPVGEQWADVTCHQVTDCRGLLGHSELMSPGTRSPLHNTTSFLGSFPHHCITTKDTRLFKFLTNRVQAGEFIRVSKVQQVTTQSPVGEAINLRFLLLLQSKSIQVTELLYTEFQSCLLGQ